MKNNHLDYTVFGGYYQLKLPLELDIHIPADDPVRLLSAFVEECSLSALYANYGRIRKSQATPRQLLKIVLYAYMNNLFSTRSIEAVCRRDINFMYLLEGKKAPDHSTLARFISKHFAPCAQQILAEMTQVLLAHKEISGKHLFIDGTKIESRAGKYTFVWKKAVTKNLQKLFDKIVMFVKECESRFGLQIVRNRTISLHTLKRIREKLYSIKSKEGICFVHGSGKRKKPIQRAIETLESFIERLNDYNHKIHRCGERNSYSKTDVDATFMRMKEDYMKNGQLKPAYNLQHGVDSEYIVWLTVSQKPTDTGTLIPFMKSLEKYTAIHYSEIIADAGYESEENYSYLKQHGHHAYIKPNNYEISKTRKYKNDIGLAENMQYNVDQDCYYCHQGKELTHTGNTNKKTSSGYIRTTSIYECKHCQGCPDKEKCIRKGNSKIPLEERNKKLYVSQTLKILRQEDEQRIKTAYGKQLRMNRSIQAEGSFAVIKGDMNFRRYLYNGIDNVAAQSVLLAMAYNINKLHHKIQDGRCRTYLFSLK